MIRAEVITLVAEDPEAHGVFDPPDEDGRDVFAEIRSVGYNEFYAAKAAGIEPSIVFVLTDYDEYQGEKIVLFNDKRYRVVRTYTNSQTIELTCELATNDRASTGPAPFPSEPALPAE